MPRGIIQKPRTGRNPKIPPQTSNRPSTNRSPGTTFCLTHASVRLTRHLIQSAKFHWLILDSPYPEITPGKHDYYCQPKRVSQLQHDVKVNVTNDWQTLQPRKTKHGSETEPSASPLVPSENPKPAHGSELEPVRAVLERSYGSETEH
jgi:hypothetical protein